MSSQITSPNTEAAILARVIQVGEEELSRGAAEYLLSIRFGDLDVARMDELSELARQGRLTNQEQAELDSYIHVRNLLAVMQSIGCHKKNEKEWKLAANTQYQDAMKIVLNLATASLVLPTVLVKSFLPKEALLKDHLNKAAYGFGVLLFLSILLCMLFLYVSAKYVKVVSGGTETPPQPLRFFYDYYPFHTSKGNQTDKPDSYSERVFEAARDVAIGSSIVCFMVGLICLGDFFLTLK